MTQATHTPTPWETGDEADIQFQCQLLMEGKGTEREWTAIHDVHEDGPEVVALCHPSNAAFIVRAVNAHGALVEALEALFNECAMVHKHWGEGCNQRQADAAIEQARAALKLAKGE